MQQLLNPFAQKYPESVDCTLQSASTVVKFNPTGPFAGHYLAAGTSDGTVEIWSTATKGLIRILEGHIKPVTGICWSRNNRYILSTSSEGVIKIHDLTHLSNPLITPITPLTNPNLGGPSQPARATTIRLDAPVIDAQFHPRNSKIILVTLSVNEVRLIDLRKGRRTSVIADTGDEDEAAAAANQNREEEEGGDMEQEVGVEKKRATLACAAWSPCGSRIYAGSTQGELLVFDPVSRSVLHRYKVANSGLRQISFDSKGQNIVLNATDRALRVLSVHPLTGLLSPLHKFTDLVNRTPWFAIGFSGDGEYVMGGAGHKMAHNVFIWDKTFGNLVKVLEGPRESLIYSDWHPTRPVIASVATSGDIHLWQISSPDNWAAFAPGFEELEENIEYDEREDEFDLEDETEASRRKDLEEDLDIDVSTPDDSFPRKPTPYIPTNLMEMANEIKARNIPNGEMDIEMDVDADMGAEENEEVRSAKLMRRAKEWADTDGDDDTWEGFFLSIDLSEKVEEDDSS